MNLNSIYIRAFIIILMCLRNLQTDEGGVSSEWCAGIET